MKISKKVWLIVGIAALVVVLAIVYVSYFREAKDLEQLSDKLALAEGRLPGLIAEREGLEDQLVQAQSSLDTSKAKFPASVESIEYGEYIFEITSRCNLTLASLSFPKPNEVKVGPVTYSVVSLSLPVSGALADIFEFIDIIKTDARFASTRVKSVNLNVAGGSATIFVDIYGYKR